MSKNTRIYLHDMLVALERVREYTSGLSFESFSSSQIVIDAVLRNLEIAGEAAKRVPVDFREAHPDIEWRKVAGLRDILVHEYASVSLGIVWDIINNKLPYLCEQLSKISGTQAESQFGG